MKKVLLTGTIAFLLAIALLSGVSFAKEGGIGNLITEQRETAYQSGYKEGYEAGCASCATDPFLILIFATLVLTAGIAGGFYAGNSKQGKVKNKPALRIVN